MNKYDDDGINPYVGCAVAVLFCIAAWALVLGAIWVVAF